MIEAFADAHLDNTDLIIAGEGPEAAALEALAKRQPVADRIRFFGRADRPAAVALFKHCEFFVLPSRIEPMGIVNLEAMAAGKAVIASDVGGVPEIVIDGDTGLLVAGGDANAMAAAMERLSRDPRLRQRLGAAGRRLVADFSWESAADHYERIYEDVLVRSSRRSPSAAMAGT